MYAVQAEVAMNMITIERTFAAAHAIYLYDGSLEPMHGHNWRIEVTVGADTLDPIETVMDFHELGHMVDRVIAPWHNASLNDQPPFSDGQGGLAVNPTAERVAQTIGKQVSQQLPSHVTMQSVIVGEAPDCRATYQPDG
jgi:6-pyruvoyltetrahydropterin/6-carboxytetrahydropterin synthase